VKCSFHPGARREFFQAIEYYEACADGLGSDFCAEIGAAINRIKNYPEAWSPYSQRTRRCLARRFPYAIIYQVVSDEIRIIAVAHAHRKPQYWESRLEDKHD